MYLSLKSKSFMGQLQSTVFLKYFTLCFNNYNTLSYVVQSLAYISASYSVIITPSRQQVELPECSELWLSCQNPSTVLHSNNQNNFLGFFYFLISNLNFFIFRYIQKNAQILVCRLINFDTCIYSYNHHPNEDIKVTH